MARATVGDAAAQTLLDGAARELAAMRRVVAVLAPLDQAARVRVLQWLWSRYGEAGAGTDGAE